VKFYASNLLPRDIPQRQRACLPCLRPWVQSSGQKKKTTFPKVYILGCKMLEISKSQGWLYMFFGQLLFFVGLKLKTVESMKQIQMILK
jgi:hypothetical protein